MDFRRLRPFALLAAILGAIAVVAGIADWIEYRDAVLLLGGGIGLAILAIRES